MGSIRLLRTAFALLVIAFTVTAQAQVTFSKKTYAATGSQMQRANFAGDPSPDLITYGGNQQISVLKNNGDGTFAAPITTVASGAVSSLAIFDYDNDGKNDFAACVTDQGISGQAVQVMRGNGDGTFSQVRVDPILNPCVGVVAGDFNKDGKQDFAVVQAKVGWGQPDTPVSNTVVTFFGNGSGAFTQVTSSNATILDDMGDKCYYQGRSAVGDFNGDGKLDIAQGTSCFVSDYTYGTIQLLLGDGAGHYSNVQVVSNANNWELRSGDVNQDGKWDIEGVGGGSGPHASSWSSLEFWINKGSNNFTSTPVYSKSNYAADYSSWIEDGTSGDFNGDGWKDAAVAYMETNGWEPPVPYFGVLIGNSDGTFTSSPVKWQLASGPNAVETGDFNHDGRLDAAVLRDGAVDVFLNTTASSLTCGSTGADRSITICAPVVDGGVHLIASTMNSRIIEAMKVYVDGVSVFWTPDDMINRFIPLSPGTHKITVKFWDALGAMSAWTTVTVPTSTSCTSSTNRTVKICSPVNGSTVTDGAVRLIAGVTDSNAVYAVKLYVDGVAKWSTTSKQIDTVVMLTNGTHRLTLKAWDAAGEFSQTVYVTVNTSSSGCAAPSTNRTVNICSPANGATVSSPVQINAALTATNGYTGAKVYVDGVVKFSTTSKTISTYAAMGSGTHRITVKGWDASGEFSKTIYISVP